MLKNNTTTAIKGEYRKKSVTHYCNVKTKLNVILDDKGNFISGWKLNSTQLKQILNTGSIGGG
ncbi:colicin D domain-containing protein [Kamptonema cortianum]|uniref:Colicin D domain-containing protein n=1 Tax=Geitlerinema calcuttense NRMC-F 0142 TaxID=2922238 RepID=A0ABT7LYC2_9CYAN|nr:colicin D domain-containing protein [Geitlerinema calcuttense]MDK3157422.1 colicin D domain-containing protein [Kamptonema cortianum]MDL5057011.1 colicin D domain-containing protein [Geitlerinema calcuttense NRMC-F 0142]